MNNKFSLILFFCFCFISTSAQAHRPGESYIFLDVTEETISGRFEVTLKHLNKVIDIDRNGDEKLTVKEFQQVADQINNHMQKTLVFYSDNQAYPVLVTGNDNKLSRTPVGNFASIHFSIPGLTLVPDRLDTEYHFLFDNVDPDHRGLMVIENSTLTGVVNQEINIVGIFGPSESRQTIRFSPLVWYETIGLFIKHGAWHILIGYDHILFIISLLLPSVMILSGNVRKPVDRFTQAFWTVVTIITLFTISHSISLTLATLDIVRLPPRLVESAIALSIAVSALNNIFPIYARRMGLVVFLFGLFHGFGFASVLAPLNLQESALVPSLLGFNLGVELGQLTIIAMVFPLLYLIRNWRYYNLMILKIGSAGLICISLVWFIKRAFGL